MKTALKGLFSLTLAAAISQPAYATITRSGNAEFPSQITPNQQICVGCSFSSGAGSLEVNASLLGNGLTSFTASGIRIGENGRNGTLRVVGNGNLETPNSAIIDINPGFGLRNAAGGTGLLELRDGGVIHSLETVYLGTQGLSSTPGTATTIVDGFGSILTAQQSSSGEWWQRIGGRIYVGFDGQSNSTVDIINGGLIEALSGNVGDQGDDGSVWIGTAADSGSIATVNVSGFGSVLGASNYIQVGSTMSNTDSSLNISDGGWAQVLGTNVFSGDAMFIGSFPGTGSATVKVNGTSSTLAAERIQIGSAVAVFGFTAEGAPIYDIDRVSLTEGQQVYDKLGNPLFDRDGNPVLGIPGPFGEPVPDTVADQFKVKGTGTLIVENDARVETQSINVSVNNPDAPSYNGLGASLTVRNGGIVTGDVNIYEDGRVNGNGSILGDVVVDGGILSPGNSPGTITIGGNLQLLHGLLEIEIAGANAGEFDVVHILGDLTVSDGFDINVKFLNGFAPQQGQTFDFLRIDGLANLDFSMLNLIVDDNAQGNFQLNFDGGTMSLVSASAVPVPTSAWLFGSALLGFMGLRRKS